MGANKYSRRRFLTHAGGVLAALGGRLSFADEAAKAPTVDEWISQGAAEAPLTMQFRGDSAAECRQWQAEFGGRLRSLLGTLVPPTKWNTIVKSTAELEDHRRDELVLTAAGCPPLPIYLLVPKGRAKGPRPGILAIHGHGAYGHHPVAGRDELPGVANSIAAANYDYGRQLVRRGYVVATPCLTPFGPRLGNPDLYGKQDPCAVTFVRLQLLGKLLIAENLRDCLWALEMLAQNPLVDARLGCVGLSYGGRMTMLTAAVEPRIQVAVVSGALNVMQERISRPYSCGAQVVPGLLQFGDVPEIGSLIAPRHCVWEAGLQDSLIPRSWADTAVARMR